MGVKWPRPFIDLLEKSRCGEVLSKEKEQGMGRERDSRSTICQSLCQETEIDGKPDRLSAFEKPTSQ